MAGSRSDKLRRLAHELSQKYELDYTRREQIEPQYDDRFRTWTFSWQDGPTVEQVKRAARKAQPEAAKDLYYERRFSSRTIALGALRLLRAGGGEDDGYGEPYFDLQAVEDALRLVSKPRPSDDRERLVAEAVVAMADGDHGAGWASNSDVVRLIRNRGLAEFLRKSGAELTPIEALTDRYASSRASVAWRYRLTPMSALQAFAAVQADPAATPEHVAAALTLVPRLHAELDLAADMLRARAEAVPAT
ncbi:hypothetical protein ACWDXD_24720 [Streptomyces sp. NPDC003314]